MQQDGENSKKYRVLIFMVETPFLERYYKRYGIDELRELGFEVVVYDLSPCFQPIAYKKIVANLCDYEKCGIKRVFSDREFEDSLTKYINEETLLICSMGYKWEYRKVFRIIKKKRFDFCYFMQELSPTDGLTFKKDIKTKYSFSNIKAAIVRRIPYRLQGVGMARFIIGCGADKEAIDVFKRARLCDYNCPVFYFHSSNYDDCLKLSKEPRIIEDRYCLFIDQYLPYHTDLINSGINIEPEKYYASMNYLFEYIEKSFEMKVVIAAHPRSDLEKCKNYFSGRRLFIDKTCSLIKDADFVIYHFSNSLAYVMMFKKPILIVYTEEVYKYFQEQIDAVCKLLSVDGLSINNFCDNDNKKEQICNRLKIDEETYKNYIVSYMKRDYSGKIEGDCLWKQIGMFLKKYE